MDRSAKMELKCVKRSHRAGRTKYRTLNVSPFADIDPRMKEDSDREPVTKHENVGFVTESSDEVVETTKTPHGGEDIQKNACSPHTGMGIN